jgi:hypothetical protein
LLCTGLLSLVKHLIGTSIAIVLMLALANRLSPNGLALSLASWVTVSSGELRKFRVSNVAPRSM